jgi:hypothetical protein
MPELMVPDERREVMALVRDVLQDTKEGHLTWSQADDAGEAFDLETSGGSLRIVSVGKKEHPFRLLLFDTNIRKVFEMETEVASFYSEEESLLEALFRAAHASVYDVSGTVQRIRNSLDL